MVRIERMELRMVDLPPKVRRMDIEESLPADDVDGHVRLCGTISIPVSVGESIYSIRQCIGDIAPWLKVAHLAETFDVPVCPHFLMELHVGLACAVPNGKYVEYIPQLDDLTHSGMVVENGFALAPFAPGIGIDRDWQTVKARSIGEFTREVRA